MGSFSNFLENSLLNHTFKNSAYTQPTDIYVGLSTADPGETSGTLAEPNGNNYSRTLCNTWSVATTGALLNATGIVFPAAGGSWGTVSHFGIFDDISAGNMLAYGQLGVSKSVTLNDIVQFNPSGIVVRLD